MILLISLGICMLICAYYLVYNIAKEKTQEEDFYSFLVFLRTQENKRTIYNFLEFWDVYIEQPDMLDELSENIKENE